MSEQPKPKGKGEAIFPLVIKDLQERERKGIETYGESLRADNGRNALQDLYEELLDAALYVKQVIVEKATGRQAVKDAYSLYKNVTGPFKAYKPMSEPEFSDYASSHLPMPCGSDGPAPLQKVFGMTVVAVGPEVPPVESIAQEAHRLVYGDRNEAYGHPIFDMTRSADMFTALLRDKLRAGVRLEAEDICQAMICVKQSRQRNKEKRDNLVDTAGYAVVGQKIMEWRAANPGVDPRDVFPGS